MSCVHVNERNLTKIRDIFYAHLPFYLRGIHSCICKYVGYSAILNLRHYYITYLPCLSNFDTLGCLHDPENMR